MEEFKGINKVDTTADELEGLVGGPYSHRLWEVGDDDIAGGEGNTIISFGDTSITVQGTGVSI